MHHYPPCGCTLIDIKYINKAPMVYFWINIRKSLKGSVQFVFQPPTCWSEMSCLQLNSPRGNRGAFKGSKQQNRPSNTIAVQKHTAAHACTHQVLLNLCTVCTCTRAHSGIISSIPSSGVCFARPPEASGKHWTVIPSFSALFSLQGGKIITLQAQNNSRGNEIILFYAGFVSSSVKYVQYEIEHHHLRIHFNN